jgi:hypothetical protein
MSAPPPVSLVSPNTWTKVIWGTGIQQNNGRFSLGGVQIQWRRYSSDPPFHTWGDHNTDQPFGAILFGAYTDFWFYSPISLTVTWRL